MDTGIKQWWKPFYEQTPFEAYMLQTDEASLQSNIDLIIDELQLHPGSTVFDQCCGFGRMSLPLAQRGLKVVGVDLCRKYIEQAKANANAGKLDCEFFEADALEFVPANPCDGAINWWTSFGYSTEDHLNRRMLQRVFDSLKPGGRFALDYPNTAHYLATFKPQELIYFEGPEGRIEVHRQTVINLERGLREQTWTFVEPNKAPSVHHTSLKMYLPNQIIDFLVDCAFVDVKCICPTTRQPISTSSERCIFVCAKPA